MKGLLSLLFVFACIQANSQNIYTKDGVLLGKSKDLLKQCTEGAKSAMMELDGIKIDIKEYCSCAMETLMPEITMEELTTHMERGDMVEFLTTGKNLQIIIDCATPSMVIEDDFEFKDGGKYSEAQINAAVETCVLEIMKDPEMEAVMTKEEATSYCSCAVEGLFEKGISYGELKNVGDPSHPLFNELVAPCMTLALSEETSIEEDLSGSGDIVGPNNIEEIPIVNLAGNGYNVKIGLGEIDRYFLIDSGASDVIINSQLEKELLKSGLISGKDYNGTASYSLADGSLIECEMVIIPVLTIGNFTVYNVAAAIMPDGSPLLGQSFLSKFSSWKIKTVEEVLVLENN